MLLVKVEHLQDKNTKAVNNELNVIFEITVKSI